MTQRPPPGRSLNRGGRTVGPARLLRERALASVDDPNTALTILEWGAEDGCAVDDWDAIAQGTRGLGCTVSHEAILSSLAMDGPAPGLQDRGDVPERLVARRTRFPAGGVLLRGPRPDHQGRRTPSLIMSRKPARLECVTQCRG